MRLSGSLWGVRCQQQPELATQQERVPGTGAERILAVVKSMEGHEKNKMQPTNPNAHTYVNGTDVETHGYAVTQNTFLQ